MDGLISDEYIHYDIGDICSCKIDSDVQYLRGRKLLSGLGPPMSISRASRGSRRSLSNHLRALIEFDLATLSICSTVAPFRS